MLIIPDTTPGSRTLLDQAIADKVHVRMLVMGDSNGQDVIASKADIRAQAAPAARSVVWIRDAGLFSAAERTEFTGGTPSNVVCVLDLDDKAVAFLDSTAAHSFVSLEKAFLKGEAS